jgi:hypothetical protein
VRSIAERTAGASQDGSLLTRPMRADAPEAV